MRKFNSHFHQEGFTLLETMMAVGLSGLVLMAVFLFFTSNTNKFAKMSEDIENSTDIEAGQRIMLKDLKAIDPSFGVSNIQDDQHNKFFEFFPDIASADLKTQPTSRTITLKLNGGLSEIIFLMMDGRAHELPSLVYDPTWAYDQAQASFISPGAITFRGINNGGTTHTYTVSSLRPPIVNAGKVLYPGYWVEGQLLMLDTPSSFRPEGVLPKDYNEVPPRPPFFVGIVSGGQLKPLEASLQALLETVHPLQTGVGGSPKIILDSADTFLRTLPANGGGQPLVRLRPVKMVKYSIVNMYPDIPLNTTDPEKKKRAGMVRLFKQVYTKGKWDDRVNRFEVAEKLRSVQFKRNSVTDKSVFFDISTTELKKGGE